MNGQPALMNSQLVTMILIVSASGMVGLFIGQTIYAQNGTDTDTSIGGQLSNTVVGVVALITSIAAILKILSDKGWIPAKIGTGAVIASDTARSSLDNRFLMRDVLNGFVETLKVDNPQSAAKIEEVASKYLKIIDKKIAEYQPKVEKFERIAAQISEKGEKTVDAIKDDEKLKQNIPNAIIPTEEPTSPE